jgi:hypothetical protein
MFRYFIIAIYPLLFVVCAVGAFQTRRLSRNFPSRAWMLMRRLMLGFMVFQVYGIVRTATVVRVFTWVDLVSPFGVLMFCFGLTQFARLLLQDARGLRAKSIKVFIPPPPISGDLPPEVWEQKLEDVVRRNIKPEYLVEIARPKSAKIISDSYRVNSS